MLVTISIVLAVVCVILLVYIYAMKKQARDMSRELGKTRRNSYNRQLRLALFDKDLNELAVEINRNLDYQKVLKLETEQSRQQLKQSISDIAHDLRTPLTVVKGNLQMLERDESLSPRGAEQLRISRERTDVLREMVDDFFEMSVLESDMEAVELADVDVTAFLMQFVIDHETVIREHGLTPRIELPEKSVFIRANELLLTRMCSNLLNNVLKYARDEFGVALYEAKDVEDDSNTELSEVCVVFSNKVSRDTAFDVEKLFERTYRGDKARPAGGAGLGLYIVKLLANKQGAGVSARMEGESLYMEMRFRLTNEC